VAIPWAAQHVNEILEGWYPGESGGTAIADVLLGRMNPAGRLPVTFPASDTQGPAPTTQPQHYPGVNGIVSYDEGLDVGYRWYDATGQRPLFPFGYGLSYERFDVSGLRAFYNRFDGSADVVARVRNTSRQSGPTTVELYLESPAAAGEPPKQLKGYTNVTLGPGQSRYVVFRLSPSDLAYYNTGLGKFTVAPGRYTVLVGTSSTALDNRAGFEVGRSGHSR
jgi:beta-glucosidase